MLTEPDILVGGLSIWVERRQYPDASDYWDGNWLIIRARMEQFGAKVEIQSPGLMTVDFKRFHEELTSASITLSGEARLLSLEPDLKVTLAVERLGRVAVEVEITPDHLSQFHRFEFHLDQTYLPPLIRACEAILERFPVIGSP